MDKLLNLPSEIILYIIEFLSVESIYNLSYCNKYLNCICQDKHFWWKITHFPPRYNIIYSNLSSVLSAKQCYQIYRISYAKDYLYRYVYDEKYNALTKLLHNHLSIDDIFLCSAQHGKISLVETLLLKGLPVIGPPDSQGNLPHLKPTNYKGAAILAATNNRQDIIASIMDHVKDCDFDINTMLVKACSQGHLDLIIWIFSNLNIFPRDIHFSLILGLAIRYNRHRVVDWLIDYIENNNIVLLVNSIGVLITYTFMSKNNKMIEFVLNTWTNHQVNLFIPAASSGNIDYMHKILELESVSGDIYVKGFMTAVNNNQIETVKLFLIWKNNIFINHKDYKQALVNSVRYGYLIITELLLERTKNFNIKIASLLPIAAGKGHLDIVQLLISKGNRNFREAILASIRSHQTLMVAALILESIKYENTYLNTDIYLETARNKGYTEIYYLVDKLL